MGGEQKVQIVLPRGSLGAGEDDNALESALRQIAVAVSQDPELEWAEKYSANVDNEVFMMHRYCWCEDEDCPWCVGCTCPPEAHHFFVDDREVPYREWMNFYDREMCAALGYSDWREALAGGMIAEERDAFEKLSNAVNARRRQSHDPICQFCRDGGVAAAHGGGPGKAAPNFWYKPTGLKVWWYKYIGRSMEVAGPTPDLGQMVSACLAAMAKRGDDGER